MPVFCDVDPVSFNIDLKDAAKRVTEKAKAIIPVDLYGQCADLEGVMDPAQTIGSAMAQDDGPAVKRDETKNSKK